MTERPDVPSSETVDYEYDLAHEVTGAERPAAASPPSQPPHRPDGDEGGDYSYDSAHDFT